MKTKKCLKREIRELENALNLSALRADSLVRDRDALLQDNKRLVEILDKRLPITMTEEEMVDQAIRDRIMCSTNHYTPPPHFWTMIRHMKSWKTMYTALLELIG